MDIFFHIKKCFEWYLYRYILLKSNNVLQEYLKQLHEIRQQYQSEVNEIRLKAVKVNVLGPNSY